MIIVADFTRMMWVAFLSKKFEAFEKFNLLKNRVENESGLKIKCLGSNRGGKFTSNEFNTFCEVNDIKRQLSAPKTLEHNGIAKRRNRYVTEAPRAMMFENDVSKTFWREVDNTIVYIMNRVYIRKGTNKTPYELWFGHVPLVKYFRFFGSKCYIKRDDDIGKFDEREDEGMFLGYSLKNKAYRCFNQRTKTIVESANVKVDEKFGVKERMLDYNSDDEEVNLKPIQENV